MYRKLGSRVKQRLRKPRPKNRDRKTATRSKYRPCLERLLEQRLKQRLQRLFEIQRPATIAEWTRDDLKRKWQCVEGLFVITYKLQSHLLPSIRFDSMTYLVNSIVCSGSFQWRIQSGGGGDGAMAPPLSLEGALSAPEGTLRVPEGMVCKLQQVLWCPRK